MSVSTTPKRMYVTFPLDQVGGLRLDQITLVYFDVKGDKQAIKWPAKTATQK